uniref:Uncharacterized protein n=1 Tax=Glossina pallidipes TaxID=7398 RepID=A0A1B0AAI9_GLOPL
MAIGGTDRRIVIFYKIAKVIMYRHVKLSNKYVCICWHLQANKRAKVCILVLLRRYKISIMYTHIFYIKLVLGSAAFSLLPAKTRDPWNSFRLQAQQLI